MNPLVATGAYGRKANQKDWDDGKDFQIFPRGAYFSKRDCKLLKQDGYNIIGFCDLKTGEILFTVEI